MSVYWWESWTRVTVKLGNAAKNALLLTHYHQLVLVHIHTISRYGLAYDSPEPILNNLHI